MKPRKIQSAYDRPTVQQDSDELDEAISAAMYECMHGKLGISEDVARKRSTSEACLSGAHQECDCCEDAGLSFAGKRTLEIGAGLGAMSIEMVRRGSHLFAIEPGTSWCKITAKRIAAVGTGSAIQAVGEFLPFADGSFDQIVSLQVLEHVQDPEAVIQEAFRVLRPGGSFYINYENYLSFWEPHYRVRWLPLLPKSIGSIYLRLLGRDPTFLKESITYTTLFAVRRRFIDAGFSCQRRAGFMRSLQDPTKPGLRWRVWRTVASCFGNSIAIKGVMMLDGCRRAFQTTITEVMLKPVNGD